MKFYLVKSKKRCWTNKAGREALNADIGASVKLTAGNQTIERNLNKAPRAAAAVMRAVHAITGAYGIAVTGYDLTQLKAKPGDSVQVTNVDVIAVERVPVRLQITACGKKTLRERLESLGVGEATSDLSQSAMKSQIYAVAKSLRIKLKKVGPTSVERVS